MTAKVELLTPSGGKVILDPSDTAVDRTLTLPAVAGTVLNTASDIEAQVKTATSATGDAPIYACRAWVNFNGTGTVAIRASGNVSSITDNTTGSYTVNFTTAMPDVNYCVALTSVVSSAGFVGNQWIPDLAGNIQTTSVRVDAGYRQASNGSGSAGDSPNVSVAIFR